MKDFICNNHKDFIYNLNIYSNNFKFYYLFKIKLMFYNCIVK